MGEITPKNEGTVGSHGSYPMEVALPSDGDGDYKIQCFTNATVIGGVGSRGLRSHHLEDGLPG